MLPALRCSWRLQQGGVFRRLLLGETLQPYRLSPGSQASLATDPPKANQEQEVITFIGSRIGQDAPRGQQEATPPVITHFGSAAPEESTPDAQVITQLGATADESGVGEPEMVITHLGKEPGPEEDVGTAAPEEEGIQLAASLPDESLPKFVVKGKKSRKKHTDQMNVLEAMDKIKETSKAKFVESVEAHFRLLADPRRGDQLVRGMAVLPFGIGREMRIAVFAEGAAAEEAKAAGADLIGAEVLLKEVQETSGGNLTKVDKCIATPDMMKQLGKLGRILGPKGLMPNPKMGTVTTNVGQTIREMKKGRVEFRADKDGHVHACIGKVNFPTENLHTNFGALAAAVMKARPTGLKGSGVAGYVDRVSLCSTMGLGIQVTTTSFLQAMQAAKE